MDCRVKPGNDELCETDHPRPTVHSIWPCGSAVGRKTTWLFLTPKAERFIRMKCMFGHAMLISEISGTAASAASPIRYRLSCTLELEVVPNTSSSASNI